MDYRVLVIRDVQLLSKGFLKNSNHLLLRLPYKINFAKGVLNLQINDNISLASRDTLLEKLNKRILTKLSKNNGYFGNLFSEVQIKAPPFPHDDITGNLSFS
jgi:hypothetical protein